MTNYIYTITGDFLSNIDNYNKINGQSMVHLNNHRLLRSVNDQSYYQIPYQTNVQLYNEINGNLYNNIILQPDNIKRNISLGGMKYYNCHNKCIKTFSNKQELCSKICTDYTNTIY
jgi:hypothetical protein